MGSSAAPRVALATCAAQPSLYLEEGQVLPALAELDVDARAVLWDDPAVDWSDFDAVVLRSTWDYFLRYGEFCAWLDRVEPLTRVHNAPSLVRWNADKRYLRDLERRGARILPTVFCESAAESDLAGILRENGWDRAVIKPSVSGGAHRTARVEAATAHEHEAELASLAASCGALVQPFFPEIQTEGEWSFVFFDGAPSHTVIKVPVADDYRVQIQFGGTFTRVDADASLVAQARAFFDALPERPAYARIDCVRRGAELYLMEAELIEPYLYMSAAPGAIDAYARLVAKLARA